MNLIRGFLKGNPCPRRLKGLCVGWSLQIERRIGSVPAVMQALRCRGSWTERRNYWFTSQFQPSSGWLWLWAFGGDRKKESGRKWVSSVVWRDWLLDTGWAAQTSLQLGERFQHVIWQMAFGGSPGMSNLEKTSGWTQNPPETSYLSSASETACDPRGEAEKVCWGEIWTNSLCLLSLLPGTGWASENGWTGGHLV